MYNSEPLQLAIFSLTGLAPAVSQNTDHIIFSLGTFKPIDAGYRLSRQIEPSKLRYDALLAILEVLCEMMHHYDEFEVWVKANNPNTNMRNGIYVP